MNILELANMTEDDARAYLENLRWPNGPVCPHCQSTDCTRMNGKAHRKGCIQCNNAECRQQFTIRLGSVLESSKVSLRKWVLAFHLLCSSKKGFSALQLQRELGLGSYRTAWFMMHRIRHALDNNSMEKPLEGVVEVDETYVGGKPRAYGVRKYGRGSDKTPVVALVQRDGRARSAPLERVDNHSLRGAVIGCVDPKATVVTDEFPTYKGLAKHFAGHETVKHSAREYVRRREDGLVVTTNLVESYFALLKRGHYGVYHQMSKGHLHRYTAEFAFRWNHRKQSDAARREAAIRQADGKRLMYKTPA